MGREIAVVVLTHDSAPVVGACLQSLAAARAHGPDFRLIVVDNASRDGTAELAAGVAPWAEVIGVVTNLGYGAGNNLGLRRAIDDGARFVCVLNPDTRVEPDFLARALEVAASRPDCAAVQPLLLLEGEPGLINSSGNRIHFLGFGTCGQLGRPREEAPAEPAEIAFASGACTLFAAEALCRVGLFDEQMFLYQEDLELGWRLRLAGYRCYLAPRAVVHHRYVFDKGPRKFYYLERNRYRVLFTHLRGRSLLVLGPWLLAAEVGVMAVAGWGGWLRQKLSADIEFLRPSTWAQLSRARGRSTVLRRLSDAEVAEHFSAELAAAGPAGRVLRAAQPLLIALWEVLKPRIR